MKAQFRDSLWSVSGNIWLHTSQFEHSSETPGGSVKTEVVGPIPRVCDSSRLGVRIWEAACLVISQVMLLLVVQRPHSENHWSSSVHGGMRKAFWDLKGGSLLQAEAWGDPIARMHRHCPRLCGSGFQITWAEEAVLPWEEIRLPSELNDTMKTRLSHF